MSFWIDPLTLTVDFVVPALALLNLITLTVLISLRRRYEKFRGDVGEAFANCAARDDDLDMRLVAAGYPSASNLRRPEWQRYP